MLTKSAYSLTIFVLALVLTAPLTANEPGHESSAVVAYAKLWVDADGVSHFDDDELEMALEDYSPPANPIAVHAIANADTATFVLLPVGAFEDWHPAPRRQYAVIMKGVVEVTAGDGEKRRFGPGMVVLLEDTTGDGASDSRRWRRGKPNAHGSPSTDATSVKRP